jgi:hypothetical protein
MRYLLALSVLLAAGCGEGDPVPDPTLDCGPMHLAESFEGLIRSPYQQDVRPDGLTLAWGGRVGTSARLRWFSLDQDDERSAVRQTQPGSGNDMELFSVELTGLATDTRYCYEVAIDGRVLASGLSFRTAPTSVQDRVSFMALGDYGQGTLVQEKVAAQMLERVAQTDLVLTTGDNAYGSGTYRQLQDFVFEVYRELFPQIPFFPTVGNHDYMTDDGAPYFANFFLPQNAWNEAEREAYWSFDYGPVHFIGLDSEEAIDREAEDDMIAWAEDDLASTDKPWTVALWHRPAFSGNPDGGGSVTVEERLHPLMQRHGVALVLMGHQHFYERFHPLLDGEISTFEEGGVTYVITGGGGNFLVSVEEHPLDVARGREFHFVRVEVDDCGLEFEAINEEGVVFDSFQLQRC